MRRAHGLGNPEAACERQREATRRREAHAVTDRDVDRLHALSRAEHLADHLAALAERGVRTAACPRLAVLADQSALGDADRRKVERHAEVAREAEAPRVRATM